jgi:GeoRSP system PqqD family protein
MALVHLTLGTVRGTLYHAERGSTTTPYHGESAFFGAQGGRHCSAIVVGVLMRTRRGGRALKAADDVVSANLGDESILLHLDSGIYFGLDSVGNQIWHLLCDGADEETIVGRLLEEYDITEPVLRSDVASFLDQLEAKGLIHVLKS